MIPGDRGDGVDLTATDRTGLRAASLSATAAGPGHSRPVRTCVGCRRTDSWSVLVRVVAVRDDTDTMRLLPDVRHRLPGRGAWLHPEPGCLELALRRRAFGRSLRLQQPPDPAAVAAYLQALGATREQKITDTPPQGGSHADEHSMSTQQ